MKGKGGIQAKVKKFHINAHFTHCYAHELNLVMKNAASVTQNKKFFSPIL